MTNTQKLNKWTGRPNVERAKIFVPFRGRMIEARRVELLANGYWRADFISGLVELYKTDPTNDPNAETLYS
jgi:hypothetical protein